MDCFLMSYGSYGLFLMNWGFLRTVTGELGFPWIVINEHWVPMDCS